MRNLQILWQIILADFRERTRRYSYLITLMVSLFIGYLVLSGKYSFQFGTYIADYNSDWIGTTMALTGAALFTFIGFYIVRSSIARDRDTRVGEILAATSLSNSSYLLGKFISNLLVLWSMVAALAIIAFIGMLVIVPFENVSFSAFFTPFILIPVTLTILVAGLAVLFDTAKLLRGIFGNILYFFIGEFLVISGILKIPYFDGAGMGLFITSIENTIHSVYPGVKIPMKIGFVNLFEDTEIITAINPFLWNGIDWNNTLMLSRLIWPGFAFVTILLSLFFFDRFEKSIKIAKKKKTKKASVAVFNNNIRRDSASNTSSYNKIPSVAYSSNIIHSIMAEITLGFKQVPLIWLYIGIAVVVAQFFVPFEIVRKFILPAAMIWPLALWSSNGTREEESNMRALLFSSPGVHSRQFISLLLCGIFIALAVCFPMILRAAINGEFSYLMLLISTVLMIPTTALALGLVSGSKKLFEIFYLLVWYGGSIDKVKQIDLLGTVDESAQIMRILFFIIVALLSACLAYFARMKKITR